MKRFRLKDRFLLLALLTALLWPSCRREPSPAREPDLFTDRAHAVIWEKNQGDLLSMERVWGGFSEERGLLKTDREGSLVFSLKDEKPRFRWKLTYSLPAGAPVNVLVNRRLVTVLHPTVPFRTISGHLPFLRQGVNLLTFQAQGSPLTLRQLFLHTEENNPRLLLPGEGLRTSLGAGSVELLLKGRFQGEAVLTSFAKEGVQTHPPVPLRGLFPWSRNTLRLEIPNESLLSLKVTGGEASVVAFTFSPRPEERRRVVPPPEGFRPQDIVFLLWDGCQAGHLPPYGYKRSTAPNFTSLSKRALLFTEAYANASYTNASVASLFTGLSPLRHRYWFPENTLPTRVPLLTEYLKDIGYTTSFLTTNANTSAGSGFARGVDHFGYFLDISKPENSRRVIEEYLRWVKETQGPRFSYIHLMEPHFPILPPPPFRNVFKKVIPKEGEETMRKTREDRPFSPQEVQDLIDDYDSSILYADHLLGLLIDGLKKQGLFEGAMIVVLSDHGEACYENRTWGHGSNVFLETLHIPLLIKMPDSLGWRGRVETQVSTIDLFPTLRWLTGGRSSSPLPGDGRALSLPFPSPSKRPTIASGFPQSGLFSLTGFGFHYLYSFRWKEERLFSLASGKELPLSQPTNRLWADFLQGKLFNSLKSRENASLRSRASHAVSPKEIEQLKSLGYL